MNTRVNTRTCLVVAGTFAIPSLLATLEERSSSGSSTCTAGRCGQVHSGGGGEWPAGFDVNPVGRAWPDRAEPRAGSEWRCV